MAQLAAPIVLVNVGMQLMGVVDSMMLGRVSAADLAAGALGNFYFYVTAIIGMGVLMFVLNWKLAILALCVLPLFWLRTVTLTRRIREIARKQRKQEGAMAAVAAESIGAIRTVQATKTRLHVQGGGGITAKSQRAAEYDESLVKIARIMEAFRP